MGVVLAILAVSAARAVVGVLLLYLSTGHSDRA